MTASILVSAILLGLIPASIAQQKGLSFVTWWIFGAVFFLLALPLVFMAKPDRAGQRQCPSCTEWVAAAAKVCKHCGRDIPQPVAGWYPNPDPKGEGMRWWDGAAWTEMTGK